MADVKFLPGSLHHAGFQATCDAVCSSPASLSPVALDTLFTHMSVAANGPELPGRNNLERAFYATGNAFKMLRIAHCASAPRRVLVSATSGGRGALFAHYAGLTFGLPSSFTLALKGRQEWSWSSSRVYSTSYGTSSTTGRKSSRYIETLDPDKLHSTGQQILTLSDQQACTVKLSPRLFDSLDPLGFSGNPGPRLYFLNHRGDHLAFPPETEGVFYYHRIGAQIRFRLCKALEEFHGGPDLKYPDSRVWNLSLATMARNPSAYGAFLALLKHEFPIAPQDVDPKRDNHRLISTLSPQRLVAVNQRVFNISGVEVRILPRGKASPMYYVAGRARSFPDNTTGVFYYHQSDTFPTRLGELRFRLCQDLQAFDRGSDLLLPSGQPWHVSSHSLRLIHNRKPVYDHLVEEGLLEHDLYAGVPNSMLALEITPLTSLGQPFVVDLSAISFTLRLVSCKPQASFLDIRPIWIFKKRSTPKETFFSGRAVVCLERYPTLPNPPRRPHVFALRVLEFLTPMKRLSASTDILDPAPGQLVMHRCPHGYVPWGHSPSKDDTRAAITDWIRTQSVSPHDTEGKGA